MRRGVGDFLEPPSHTPCSLLSYYYSGNDRTLLRCLLCGSWGVCVHVCVCVCVFLTVITSLQVHFKATCEEFVMQES